jgi:light-regulated signal transduction histidine kinase (bacteriophytochrome)
VRAARNESLLLLQAFLCVQAVTALFVATVVDERRQALAALEFQAAELARSNAELEQFAYVASHDLQEPLRMVTSYLQLLEKRFPEHVEPDVREFIGYAVDGASRMKQLIEDLLSYSRAGRAAAAAAPTDSGRALDKAIANLALSIREIEAEVTHGEMPQVFAESSELTQVFQNLIGNSLKFRGSGPPRVRVEAERRGGEWQFSVRDNGIGIPTEFRERIFVVFQRLHGPRKYPGTGIGLALCKKIVERNGGRIWVDSQPGKGASFYFTLPVAKRSETGPPPAARPQRDGGAIPFPGREREPGG